MSEWMNELISACKCLKSYVYIWPTSVSSNWSWAQLHIHTHIYTHLLPKLIKCLEPDCAISLVFPWLLLSYTLCSAQIFYTLILIFPLPVIWAFSLPKEIPTSHWGKHVHSPLFIQEVKCQASVTMYMWREGYHTDKLLHPAFWITSRSTCYFRSITWIHWHFPPETLKHLILS